LRALEESLLKRSNDAACRAKFRLEGFLRRRPGANAERVRAVCTNAAPLWKGFWTRFFRFYDSQNMRKRPQTGLALPDVAQGTSLSSPIIETGEMPWTSP
jgi:hypothetical protein